MHTSSKKRTVLVQQSDIDPIPHTAAHATPSENKSNAA